jgi:flagellar FliL protein
MLWLIVVLVVLSVITAGVAAYLAWQSSTQNAREGENSALEREPPIFFELEPFTVNMSGTNGASRLLYIGITFKVGDQETRAILEEYIPQVRSRLLMKLADENVDELTHTEGKEQLAERLVGTLTEPPLAEPPPELVINEILFTEFIVQ